MEKIDKKNYTKYYFSKVLFKLLEKIAVEIKLTDKEKYKKWEPVIFKMKKITRDATETGNAPHLRYFWFVRQADGGRNWVYTANTQMIKDFLDWKTKMPKFVYKKKRSEYFGDIIEWDEKISSNDF